MQKTIFTLATASSLLLSLGCQPKTKTKVVEVTKPDKVYDFTRETYGKPIEVHAFDPSCNSQRGLGLSNTIIAEAYIGSETIRTSTTIEEDVWENAKQKEISRTTYELEYVSKGRPVYLCRDSSQIPVHTQEGAAISMKADADAAFALYQTIQEKAEITLPTLEQVYLHAAVKVKLIDRHVDTDEDATEDTSYLTDNAVFVGGKEPTLISYPQSEESRKLNLLGGVPLWTVKGVFQHEFGHFIFSSLMNEGGASFASYQDFAARNPDLHLFQTPAASFARIAERPALKASFTNFFQTQDFFIGSLNEGFADLWAYYTLKQPADLFEISCFARNRNIASPYFYDGRPKSWDEGLWNKIFKGKLEEGLPRPGSTQLERCSQPIFADVHIVGAAMAHTVDAVFTAAAKAQPTQDAGQLKAEMTLAWLKTLKASEEFEDLGGKATLSRILNTAIGTGLSYLKAAESDELCAVVSSKFPALVKRWKDAKTNNEDVFTVVSDCSL